MIGIGTAGDWVFPTLTASSRLRDTVFTISSGANPPAIEATIRAIVADVNADFPGCQLKQNPPVQPFRSIEPVGGQEDMIVEVALDLAKHIIP